MREILFRGKDENGEWLYGFLIQWKNGKTTITIPKGSVNEDSIEYAGTYPVDPETVGEWTGLVDDNKQKIFEGDILRFRYIEDTRQDFDFHAVVEFGNPNGYYSWGWQLRPIHGSAPNLDILLWVETEMGMYGMSCEIVGNVHDNKKEDILPK